MDRMRSFGRLLIQETKWDDGYLPYKSIWKGLCNDGNGNGDGDGDGDGNGDGNGNGDGDG